MPSVESFNPWSRPIWQPIAIKIKDRLGLTPEQVEQVRPVFGPYVRLRQAKK